MNSVWRRYLRRVFYLKKEETEEQTCREVEENITFYGHNLWLLVFAIFIACFGLNYNSSAAVIGAMLISPLMGPVIGIGFGLVVHHFPMIGKSLRHWLIAVIMSLAASTLYFIVTPVHDSNAQLYAFIRPTVFDALLAFFGGMAGFLGIARKDGSKILSGVAIATACIPPLCTAGYGLATLQWNYFLGGFYFYFINCLFIGIGVMLLARYMKFSKIYSKENTRLQKTAGWAATGISVLALAPCIWLFTGMMRENRFVKKASVFAEKEIAVNGRYIVAQKIKYGADSSLVELTVGGSPVTRQEMAALREKMAGYGIQRSRLIIHQPAGENEYIQREIDSLKRRMQAQDSLIWQLKTELNSKK